MDIAPSDRARALMSIGFGIVFSLLLRRVYKTGAMPNPMGEDRDFSSAPALKDLLVSAACAFAATAWTLGSGAAIRIHLLPDTALSVYVVFGIPLMLLFSGFIFFMGRSAFRAIFGRPRVR